MKKKAIEEWKQKELEKELKEKEQKAEADKLYQARVRAEFAAKGYSEESITKFLKKEEKHKKKEVLDLSRPTYIKVDRKYLSPDTLDAYELPWEWDDVSIHFHDRSTASMLTWDHSWTRTTSSSRDGFRRTIKRSYSSTHGKCVKGSFSPVVPCNSRRSGITFCWSARSLRGQGSGPALGHL